MWKALFLAIVISLPVEAEEKVWYCEMTGLAQTTVDGAETFITQKFKMKVDESNVVFGSGGYFNESTIPITWKAGNSFEARNGTTGIMFDKGVFHSAQVSFDMAIAISARCDDF